MAKLDLTKYGITGTTEVVHNPSYEQLFAEETKPELEGYEKGQVSELGAVNVMTGIYTGRSPKDKFIVMDENSKDTVWWTSDEYKNDNHPASQEAWKAVKEIAQKELSNKRLYVVDAFCGANKDTRMAVRFIVEVAWQAHFVTNMFIRPTAEELENFEPDFVVYNASKAKVENFKELGLNSETCVAFNITSREQVIVNTWYGGEMKKSGAKAYLVNTGWNGTGKRISIKDTRGIIDAILDPRDTYADAAQWEEKAKDLAARFQKNFVKYESNADGKALVSAGPQL